MRFSRGRPPARRFGPVHHGRRGPPERLGARRRRGDRALRRGHLRRGDSLVPRARHRAALSGLGPLGRAGQGFPPDRAVDRPVPRAGPRDAGRRDHRGRRRTAREDRAMTAAPERAAAIELLGLSVSYARGRRRLRALWDVSLRIERGETYGLVGESGSGKTTLALTLMRHLPRAARIEGGRVMLAGDDLLAAGERTLRRWRARRIALVPQGAGGALNPSLRVGTQMAEIYRAHGGLLPAEAVEASARMLTEVRVGDPARVLDRYPHELSAGQQQRVLIGMALAANPEVLILDEPTTALDATVEAEVLDLIEALQGEIDAAILLISHDVRVVARLCDRVGLLYAGRLLEEGPAEEVVRAPRHPHTLALLRCVPRLDAGGEPERLVPISGRAPDPGAELHGCSFAGRCPIVRPRCHEEAPPAAAVAPGGTSRCHYHAEVPSIRSGAVSDNGKPPAVDGTPLLRVSRLSKTYRAGDARIEAVADVSFELRHGEVLGLVGESGSGKTSLARCIAGLAEPSAGSLELDGEE